MPTPGYSHKVWKDQPDHTTPISAAALEDLEDRVTQFALDTASTLSSKFKGVWSSGTTYALGDGVSVGVNNYVSTINANLNNNPVGDNGSHWTPTIPSTVVTGSSASQGRVPVASGASNAATWQDKADLDIRDWGSVDVTGAVACTTALRATITQAVAMAGSGYAHNKAVSVRVPGGRFLLDGKITIPESVTLQGAGYGATSFYLGSNSFPDNCVFENAAIDLTQEYMGLAGFSLYGQGSGGSNISTTVQANAGVATTVNTTIANPVNAAAFDLVAVGSIAAYATNGTLSVGTKRVVYQGVDVPNKTFKACWVTSGYGTAITAGDAISAITTDNVVGIRAAGLGAPSFVRDVFVSNFSDNCFLFIANNAMNAWNLWSNFSNRDSMLWTGYRASNWLGRITAQYSGTRNTGAQFAALHIQGQSALQNFQGLLSLNGLYMEQSADNQIGLWLDNMGSFDGYNINLQGGAPANPGTQTCIQIDSTQASPLTQDSLHAANISLHNLHCSVAGRVLLKDNVVRSGGATFATPANANANGTALTRYVTEDQLAKADRIVTLRRGSLTAYRDNFDPIAATSGTITLTSGTQTGGTIELLAGETYDHIVFLTATTPATWGSNNDGHWYAVVYDSSGNLAGETADGGHTGLAASTPQRIALVAPITPTVDAEYTVLIMVYIGTGGAPVMPTLKGGQNFVSGQPVSGMPQRAVTANAGQTTGANAYANPAGGGLPPATLGVASNNASVPWMALYK